MTLLLQVSKCCKFQGYFKTALKCKVSSLIPKKNIQCLSPKPSTPCSHNALRLGILGFGLIPTAQCQSSSSNSRLVGLQEQLDKQRSATEFPWRQFLSYIWPHLKYLLAAVASALAVAILNIKIPQILGNIVNVVAEFNNQELDASSSFLVQIRDPVIQMIKYYVAQSLMTFGYIWSLSCFGERVAAAMREDLFTSIIRQDISFFDANKTGEIVSRLTSDVQDFKSSFKLCISQGLRSFAQTIGCGVALYMISPQLTAMMLAVVPSVIIVGTIIGSGLRSLSKKAQIQVSKATAISEECISNIRTVRAFAMENKEQELYHEELSISRGLNELLGFGIGIFQGGTNLFLNGIVLANLYYGGYLLSREQMSPGDLMSFLVATQTIQRSLSQLSQLFGQYIKGMSAGVRIFEYINLKPDIPLSGGTQIPFHSFVGNIELKDVIFHYPSRPEQRVLDEFSLKIPAGKVVALVGTSGGGKSTVANLLERFYECDIGKITIDDQDIKDLDPKWLRGRLIGYINQEPVLFATSVMENIRYGRPDATDAEVFEAAKAANADSFIRSFPEGYDTLLGERGITVSGGQKQRIAIARALLKSPSILILDEATSALDAESEKIVQDALEGASKGKTVLVIAHRLSTIQNADLIAVISRGKVQELGTHAGLKRKGGIYAELIRQQESAGDSAAQGG